MVLDGATLTEHLPTEPVAGTEPSWSDLASLVPLTVYPRTAPSELLERARTASILLTNKVVLGAETLRALPSLRYVGVMATGTNVVDLEAARRLGIVVTNVPSYATNSVASHVMACILGIFCRVAEHDAAVHQGDWVRCHDFTFSRGATYELSGRTLGIVGLGEIGRAVARLGQAFGMRVIAASRTPSAPRCRRPEFSEEPTALLVPRFALDEVFSQADIVSLHCPLTEDTRGMVNARRLALMKPDAVIVNTARGGLVEEASLAHALHEGRIGGAALDVLSTEPPSPDNPLLSAPRCLITPHRAWATKDARRRLMECVTENVRNYLAGTPRNVVE